MLELVAEPEAAVAAYGLAGRTVLVLHIGGRSQYAWVKPHHGQAATRHKDWGGSLLDQRLLDHFQNVSAAVQTADSPRTDSNVLDDASNA